MFLTTPKMSIDCTYLIPTDCDPMGQAITDYFNNGKAKRLIVKSSMFDDDEIPVKTLFRNYEQLSPIERTALDLANGKILDVGAGSGCHSLILQDKNKDVVAIDISALSVEIMTKRGITDARHINLFDPRLNEKFDTLLMLMNGSGIIGKINNLHQFFTRAIQLLNPEGQILLDSSDLIFLYEDEDGGADIDLAGNYYGEVDFTMKYGKIIGKTFDWLYIDFDTLSMYALQAGFKTEKIYQGSHYDYLARLTIEK